LFVGNGRKNISGIGEVFQKIQKSFLNRKFPFCNPSIRNKEKVYVTLSDSFQGVANFD